MDSLTSNVNDYLEGLSEAVLARLYQSPSTCLAIFRLLPSLAKILITKMLFQDGSMSLSDIDSFVRPDSRKLQIEALQKLRHLHLIREKISTKSITLSSTFRASFRNVLTAGDVGNSFGVPCDTEDKHKVDLLFLDQHAILKWEGILHFMVGTQSGDRPGDGVLSLLKHSGLMEGADDSDLSITHAGFQFLLQDVNAQIWTLLLRYLNMASSLQMDPVDVLNFIFMLGSLKLGQDYSLSALSDTQIKMLEDLRDFGIVYQRKASSRRFYPTRLATTLTSDSSALRTASASMEEALKITKANNDSAGKQGLAVTTVTNATTAYNGAGATASTLSGASSDPGFIILETNYRLYAYTDSPLQVAVLNLFIHLKTRFANMVTGQITRESVRRALRNGIQADQIITYLTVHAHPQMRKNNPVLPPTVVDQIKLWQLEMDRIKPTDGFLYSNFRNAAEFQMVADYAKELGVLVWQHSNKRKFFVTKEGTQQIIDFITRNLSER